MKCKECKIEETLKNVYNPCSFKIQGCVKLPLLLNKRFKINTYCMWKGEFNGLPCLICTCCYDMTKEEYERNACGCLYDHLKDFLTAEYQDVLWQIFENGYSIVYCERPLDEKLDDELC